MPSPKTRIGRKISLKEEAFINANVGTLTPEEMGKKLALKTSTVEAFLSKRTKNGKLVASTLAELRESYQYQMLQEEFNPKEIKIFEKSYCEWVAQFQGDILFSEKGQIFNAVKQEIIMSNTLKQKKSIEETMTDIDREIVEIKESEIDDMDKRDKISSLRKDRTDLHGALSTVVNQHQKQNELFSRMLGELKASRSNRETQEESSKNNIMTLIRSMADDEQRIIMGEEAELERLSAQSEGVRYRQPTELLDGTLEKPFVSGKE